MADARLFNNPTPGHCCFTFMPFPILFAGQRLGCSKS